MSKLPRLLPLIAIAIGGVVAVRAAGVAPELFQGATAWAQEAVTAETPGEGGAAKPAPAPAVCALTPEQLAQQAGISPAELRIIQSLSKRRDALDARDADFATTLPLMVAAEQKLDAKLQALEALKGEIAVLVGQVDEKERPRPIVWSPSIPPCGPRRRRPSSTPWTTACACRSPPPCARAPSPPSWPRCRPPAPVN